MNNLSAEALIVTLREGLEAALVVGLILAYLNRTGRVELKRFAYSGLILAIAASGLAAFIFQTLNFGEEVTDIVEAYVMLLGSLFVGTMVVWMFRAGRSLRYQVEQRIETMASKRTRLMQGLSLLLLAFTLVFREGVETVLFLAALSFKTGSNPFLIVLGGLLGLGIASVLGLLILKGLVRVNLRVFFTGTGIVLLALIATLIANAVHNFAEFGYLQLSTGQLSVIGLFVREETSVLILVSIMAVPAVMITLDSFSTPSPSGTVAQSAAQRRLGLADVRRRKFLARGISLLLLTVLGIVGVSWASAAGSGSGYDPPVRNVRPEEGMVRIALSELSDGLMHKYSVDVHGVLVRFFMLQPSGGPLRVALDACYICPPVGYYMKDEGGQLYVVCKNCDAPINIDTIGMPGGCNPRVLRFQADESYVTIDLADLEASAQYFA